MTASAVDLELRVGSSLATAPRSSFLVGGVIRVWAFVRDAQTRNLVPAPSIIFKVWNPQGAQVSYTGSQVGSTVPGVYWCDIPATLAGGWSIVCETRTTPPDSASVGVMVAAAEPDAVSRQSPPWVDRTSGLLVFPDNQPVEATSVLDLPTSSNPTGAEKILLVTPDGSKQTTLATLAQVAAQAGAAEAGAESGAIAGAAAAEPFADAAAEAAESAETAEAGALSARAGAEDAEASAQAAATAAQASASTARLVVATAAELTLSYPDATIAEVILDGHRNGTWRKYGAIGSGEWLRTSTATIYTLAARTDAMPPWEQADSPDAPPFFMRSPGGKLLTYLERSTGYFGVGAGLLLPSLAGADSGRAVVAWSRNRKPLLEWSVYRESWVLGRMEATLATIGTLRATTAVVPTIDMRAGGADGRMWPVACTPLGKILLGIEWDGTVVGRFDIASSMLAPDDVPTGLGQPDAHGVTALSGRLMRFQGRDEMGVARSYRARRTTPPVAIQEARGPLLLVHRDGQSLSVGRQGAGGGHTTAPLPHNLLMFNAGIRGVEGAALTASALTDFAPAAEVENATHGDTGMVAGARWYHARLLADGRPRRVMLLRSHGQGGSTIAQAQPGQTKFTNGETEARRAVAIAAEYGLRVECSDWSFNQGQSDPTLSKEDYLALLETYHAAYVASRRATTGQDYDPLMFIEPVCASRDEVFEGPLLAQIAFAAANPGAVFLTAPYYHLQGATGLADSVHYSGPGYALIGEYTWRARYMVRELGVAWTGVQPAGAVQVSGNVLSLPLTHPSGATLQFDTATLPDAFGTKGLRVVDATASITGVALAPVNATRTDLVVTLDGAPTSPVVGIRCAMDKVGSVTDRACAWANIRDNDATPSLAVPGQFLRNWVVPFLVTTE